ncbi:hypothetical protein ACFFGH_31110 [Lysobacter korlensis]|uniref:LPXTG cell wall anchor domain-containing protein n=1 Tax=Lysobacter korlensis TaxID=553636 RepID=A0ABV6S0S6_9GAMM
MHGLVAVLTTVCLSGWAAPTAAADQGGAQVSLDGVTWSESPSGSLFPAGAALVPGSSQTGTFWVRNASDRSAHLRISVSDASSRSIALLESLTLRATTPATAATAAVPLAASTTCTPLLSGEPLPAETFTRVTITLAMSEHAGNSGQASTAQAALSVTLADPDAPEPAAECAPGGGIPLTPPPGSPEEQDRGTDGHGDRSAVAIGDGATPALAPAVPADRDSAPGNAVPGGPTAESPPGAAAPPAISSGSAVLFPWLAAATAMLGAGIFLGIWKRKRHG